MAWRLNKRQEAKRVRALKRAMKKPSYRRKLSRSIRISLENDPELLEDRSERMIGNALGRANKGNRNCGKGSPRFSGHKRTRKERLAASRRFSGKKLSLAHRRKISRSLRASSSARRSQMKAAKAARKSRAWTRGPTSLERKLMKILDQLNVRYKYNPFIAGYFPDFKIKGTNILLEADGAHWHNKSKDKKRDKRLREAGYKVIRFPDKMILEHPEKVISKIRRLVA